MDDNGLQEDLMMRRAAGGDPAAFGWIVRAYQARLVRFAARLTGDAELAQDAAQDAFLRLWRIRETYTPCGCLQAYLFRTVRSVCLDYARAARPVEMLSGYTEIDVLDSISPDPASLAEMRSLAANVRAAVQSLPEAQQSVFVLSHYEHLSYAEIADVLHCPVGTVASRKHQAIETLRRKLHFWRDRT